MGNMRSVRILMAMGNGNKVGVVWCKPKIEKWTRPDEIRLIMRIMKALMSNTNLHLVAAVHLEGIERQQCWNRRRYWTRQFSILLKSGDKTIRIISYKRTYFNIWWEKCMKRLPLNEQFWSVGLATWQC